MLEWFQSKNIPCFESDNVGKILLENDLKQEVLDTFGPELYADGRLDTVSYTHLTLPTILLV